MPLRRARLRGGSRRREFLFYLLLCFSDPFVIFHDLARFLLELGAASHGECDAQIACMVKEFEKICAIFRAEFRD
jgi:hypothetical protein